ncbi:FAD binding domain-containing protein [Clostridium grantii]|uniref:CO or xanthine dehydrogenase, FAD-binding subunit n=1 Tax=Clostridium grantii DSM 8605 TaxID=1121316 RepID=A0A1M5VT45_9CLOT|nr:FAD binding domain-containing protein [Clostridium grantii]SHH78360.1 CO or xanthine dehydrogenase, FAD-binding subunit [Clostridium grantii DSM 8605]
MFTIQQYAQPVDLKEAYEILMEKKNNTVLGGCAWLRMGNKRIGTAIDLTSINLDFITEDNDYIEIGAMTSLREVEINSILKEYSNGIICSAVSNIIGVQFRNVVTVGGSVFSRFGFSDFITPLLAIDTQVELFKGGRMLLKDFLKKPYEKDILVKLIIKKENINASYKMIRNSAADFPLLNVAVAKKDKTCTIVVGARPARAEIAEKASKFLSENTFSEENIEKAADMAVQELTFEGNKRASKEYREEVSKVLVKRAIKEAMLCK